MRFVLLLINNQQAEGVGMKIDITINGEIQVYGDEKEISFEKIVNGGGGDGVTLSWEELAELVMD